MKRKLISLVSTLIHESGIEIFQSNESQPYTKSWRFFVILTVNMLLGMSTVLQSVLTDKSVDILINSVPFAAAGCVVTSHSLIIIFCKKILSEMLHQMDFNVYTYPDEGVLDVSYKWYLKEENVMVALKIILVWQLMNLWGLLMPGLIELFVYNKIETFIFPGWTPWKKETLAWQVVTFIWQFFPPLCGIWLNQIVIMLISVVLSEFLRQYERLGKAIESLKVRTIAACGTSGDGGVKDESKYEQEMERNIICCIKHHQKIRENFHLFKMWFSTMISFELTISSMTLAIGLYAMINASKLSILLHYAIVVAYMMVNLLIKCLIGETFIELNNNIAYALFSEFEWFELGKGSRQLVVLFHHITCQPLHLYGLEIFPVTRALYGSIIRITYSVLNVLNISLNK